MCASQEPTSHHASAVSLQRAAATGHAWLSRLPAKAHAGHVVEPALLASVRPPPVTYVPAVPRRLAKTGVLSELQLEAMLHAGQCHAQPLRPNGSRPGFLLADGAGVGKGRTQAAILLDAWLQGHQKAVWVSASADLFADARRDLHAVCTAIPGTPPLHRMLTNLTSVPQQSPIPLARGVVFASYALLARPGRLAQVLAWCASRTPFQGVLALDECHRAKAAGATGAGSAVLQLQSSLPLARVVYSSATSATELHNLQYLSRLGLWGLGTPFHSFNAFKEDMQLGGAAAKELLPLHLKAEGSLVSRLISYDGVKVRVATHCLTPEQAQTYDGATELWQQLALVLRKKQPSLPSSAASRFWSAHQRFFRCLVTASKLPTLHSLLSEGLEEGKSVVVGLLGTGEAYTASETAAEKEGNGGGKEGSGRKSAAAATTPPPSRASAASAASGAAASGSGGPIEVDLTKDEVVDLSDDEDVVEVPAPPANGSGKGSKEKEGGGKDGNGAAASGSGGGGGGGGGGVGLPPAPSAILKSVLTSVLYPHEDVSRPSAELSRFLAAAEALQLPPNPLDEIISTLTSKGVPVVELSGRQEVAGQRNAARERFQSGEALVAVISDAASTGVSLHAPFPSTPDTPVRPRLHITLELNWSADRQIQQLGRTHRTGQACPPEHVLLVTDVCGEKRFVSTVARRLRSLGALSGDGGGLSEGRWSEVLQSLETEQGSAALVHMYSALGFALAPAAEDGETQMRQVAERSLRGYLRARAPSPPPPAAVEAPTGGGGRKKRARGNGGSGLDVTRIETEEEDDDDEEEDVGVGSGTQSSSSGTEELDDEGGDGGGSMMHEVFATREAAVTKRGEIEGALKRAAQHLLPDAMMISPKGKRGRGGGSNSSSASRDPMPRSKASSVTLFLNRLLGLQLSDQALLLHLFNYLLRSAVRRAKRDGALDQGVESISTPMLITSALLFPDSTQQPQQPSRMPTGILGGHAALAATDFPHAQLTYSNELPPPPPLPPILLPPTYATSSIIGRSQAPRLYLHPPSTRTEVPLLSRWRRQRGDGDGGGACE